MMIGGYECDRKPRVMYGAVRELYADAHGSHIRRHHGYDLQYDIGGYSCGYA
jgi:hypothetical protein